MFVIAKIRVHPKKGRTYEIELTKPDDQGLVEILEVHEDLIVKYGLRKGMPIPDQKRRELLEEREAHEVYQSALNYISYRMRSVKEVETQLFKKGFTGHFISEVLERLIEENLLNDRDFANAYVRSKKNLTTKGPVVLQQELLQKGVPEAFIVQAMEAYSEEEQVVQALQFAKKKQTSWGARSSQEQKMKLRQALQQKGFSTKIITQVLNQMENVYDEQGEWQAIMKQGEKALGKYKGLSGYEKDMKIKQFLFRKGFQSDMIDQWLRNIDEEE